MNDLLHRSIVASIGDLASRAPAPGPTPLPLTATPTARRRRSPVLAAATLVIGAAALVGVIVIRSHNDVRNQPTKVVALPTDTDPATSATSSPVVATTGTTVTPGTAVTPGTTGTLPVSPPAGTASLIDSCLISTAAVATSLDPVCSTRQNPPGFAEQLQTAVLSVEGYALYTVRAGDTLGRIAAELDRPFDALVDANGGSPDLVVVPSMLLLVPPLYTHDLASAADQPPGTESIVSKATGFRVGFAVGSSDRRIGFADDINLPDVSGPAVRLADGTITGYFVLGTVGFVDVDLVNDKTAFAQLIQCYNSIDAGIAPEPECDVPFLRQGVNPYIADRIAALNADLPGHTPPTNATNHS